MRQLISLQRAFQRHVYRPRRAMEREVLSTPSAGAARRLSVYSSAYRARLVEALGNDYEAMQALLGEHGFEKLMLDFIAARPSRHRNLRWYGGELARFLSRSPRWRRRPLLAELAEFEWALGLAFDAADAPAVSADEIARVPAAGWPAMRLRLHPSVRQLPLRSNAPQVWRAASTGRKPPAAALRRWPTPWLVWRKGLTPCYRPLPADEARALELAARGRDFASLSGALRRFVGDERAALRAAQLLRNWLSEGLVCGIDLAR